MRKAELKKLKQMRRMAEIIAAAVTEETVRDAAVVKDAATDARREAMNNVIT